MLGSIDIEFKALRQSLINSSQPHEEVSNLEHNARNYYVSKEWDKNVHTQCTECRPQTKGNA